MGSHESIALLSRARHVVLSSSKASDADPKRAVEQERKRISREVHDGVAQEFQAIIMHLRLALATAGERGVTDATSTALAIAQRGLKMSRALLADLQAHSRQHSDELSPLADIIRDTLTAATQYSKVKVEIGSVCDVKIRGEMGAELSKVLWEIAMNAVKHSAAGELVCQVTPAAGEGVWMISVRDNGVGFEPRDCNAGWGIRGMNERVRNIGGALEIHSAPRQGTTVLVWIAAQATELA